MEDDCSWNSPATADGGCGSAGREITAGGDAGRTTIAGGAGTGAEGARTASGAAVRGGFASAVPVGRGKAAAAAAGGVVDELVAAGSGAGAVMAGSAAGGVPGGGGKGDLTADGGAAGSRVAGVGVAPLVGGDGSGEVLRTAAAVAFGDGRAAAAAAVTGVQPGTGRPACAFIFLPCALTILHSRNMLCLITLQSMLFVYMLLTSSTGPNLEVCQHYMDTEHPGRSSDLLSEVVLGEKLATTAWHANWSTHLQAVLPVLTARSPWRRPRRWPSVFHSQKSAPRSGRPASRFSVTAPYTVLQDNILIPDALRARNRS